MDASEIDDEIARLRAAEARIAANLVELDDHPTFALVTSGVLTGATARRAAPLAAAAPSLWEKLDALRRTLDLAEERRGRNRMNAAERADVEHILRGPSVLVEVASVPLAERDLLAPDSVERRVTLAGLVDELRADYEPLRDLVAEIDAVWRDTMPRLDAAEVTLGELEDELRLLGMAEPTVEAARRRLGDARRQVMDDPIGVGAGLGASLDQEVTVAARRVGRLRDAHDSLHGDLARTESLVAEARSLRARAAALRSETIAKIADPAGLVMVPAPSAIDLLAAESRALREGAGSAWHHVRARLDPWLARAERLCAQLRDAVERNGTPLARRDELRGLLEAYRSKAAAVGLAERADLADLADDAHNELYTAPADLERAAVLVAELGAGLAREGETS